MATTTYFDSPARAGDSVQTSKVWSALTRILSGDLAPIPAAPGRQILFLPCSAAELDEMLGGAVFGLAEQAPRVSGWGRAA
jgi:hypothetical protein